MKIPCELIKDLMPQYIDNLCSETTRNYINNHLSNCTDCKEYHKKMCMELVPDTLSPEDVELEKEPFLKIRKKNVIRLLTSIILTAVICFALFIAGSYVIGEVGFLSDIFSPHEYGFAELNEENWTAVAFESGDETKQYFEPESIFFKGEIVNHANNPGEITIRIKDEDGTILADGISIPGGRGYHYDVELNKQYIIEAKAADGRYWIIVH